MPPRATRSKSSKGAAAEVEASASFTSAKSLESEDNIHRICILPKTVGNGTRIVYLPHPATSAPAAFVFCHDTGRIFELTKISAPKAAARSWLISADQTMSSGGSTMASAPSDSLQKGYVIKNADALVATPFDPVFLLLRLFPVGKSQERNSFRLGDDYLELLSEQNPAMAGLLRSQQFSKNILKRFECICESQDIGDEKVYKPSNEKLTRVLVEKACRMVSSMAWPASMDEGVVKKELDIPSIPVHTTTHIDTTTDSQVANAAVPGTEETPQTTSQLGVDAGVIDVMRMRKALEYLLSAYVPKALRDDIELLLKDDKIKSITPLLDPTLLQAHLDKIKAVKAEAMALRSLSDNISRKRGADDEEQADARAEKKRKKEEEDKKAKSESRNLKQLKKVDTTGMKKLSSFFTKAPAKGQAT